MTTRSNVAVSGAPNREALPFIEGGLGYPVDDVTTTHEGTAGHAPRRCRVYDARPIVGQLSLDHEGFVLLEHESKLASQADHGLLRREHLAYLHELTPLIKDVMDASWVVARQGGVVVRSATKLDPVNPVYAYNKGGIEVPYPNVHLDYNFASAVQLARGENYQQGLADRPFSRLVVLQAWRAISPPPQDRPLALMDASTLSPEDTYETGTPLHPGDLSTNSFQTRGVHFNPDQRWYYFSEMAHTEVVLFKGMDTDAATNATPPHSSFVNESLGSLAQPRESVEARFFVYYD
jgi:hypothetical protein